MQAISNRPKPDGMHAVVVPDLGMPAVTITLSVWLVPLGARVESGERIVELLAGDATVDLAAPVGGILSDRRVAEDELVASGQVVAYICPTSKR